MSDKKILVAFFLNICFSLIELFGGVITNSVSIISDAMHDFGDAISIGVSYFLERISKRHPDNKYTYGYQRYSVLGALITNAILISGSILVVISAIKRFINPVSVNYEGMIILAIFGVFVNFIAAFFTREGDSLNQRAVNLHMLEDCFGWVIVLIGAIVIKFTNINRIDALLSIVVAIFIFVNALKGINKILNLFLEKIPENVDIEEIRKHLLEIKGVLDIHHIHIWSIDGVNNYGTLHVVCDSKDMNKVKLLVKNELKEHGISHATVEMEDINDKCSEIQCEIEHKEVIGHHH